MILDFNLSPEFKKQFCLLFDIKNLDQVIQTKITVDNEQPSISLTDFYRSSIDLIQHFLLSKKLISDARSIHLSTIFSHMKFICVNSIHLSYCHGTNTVKVPSTSYNTDTYIDEQTSKFYILKKFEASEMRYTDAMVHFIVEDETTRSKLLPYIKELLQIYQNEGAQGLANRRENITEKYEPKWTIAEEIGKDVPVVGSSIQEAEEIAPKKPEITDEMIEQLKKEGSIRPKLPPRPKVDANVPNDFLPRLGGEKDPSAQKSDDSSERNPSLLSSSSISNSSERNPPPLSSPLISNSSERNHPPSSSISNSNDPNHQASEVRERNDHEHVARENTIGDFIDGKYRILYAINMILLFSGTTIKKEPDEDSTKSSYPRFIHHPPRIDLPDSTAIPPPSFEQIPISTLVNFDLFSAEFLSGELSTSQSFPTTSTEADSITGRRGEELVFRYLKEKYPNETIKWMNEEEESYESYDIHRIKTSENDREEFIEVKTTRVIDQNTFPISIGEVKYLLKHSSNYFIYRVYYADSIKLSTITVINKVKDYLESKHIKLSMTIPPQSSD